MSRMFGQWPIPSFTKLDKEQQMEFWKEDGRTATGIVTDLTKSITKQRVQVRNDIVSGKYLPLKVYESMGYNILDIEQKLSRHLGVMGQKLGRHWPDIGPTLSSEIVI